MVDHIKLEIAVQLMAEKIAEIYKKLENNTDPDMLSIYEQELNLAFDQKERVEKGEVSAIEQILRERSYK